MPRVGGKRRAASPAAPRAGKYTLCAVARGTVRFAHPSGWAVRGVGTSVVITDAEPPAETQAIEVSVLNLPPLPSTGLTLVQVVTRAGRTDGDGAGPPDLRQLRRGGVEIVWTEKAHGEETPPLVVRHAWCYGDGIYAVFCYGFRLGASGGHDDVWTHLLGSIELGPSVGAPDGMVVN